MSGTVKAGLHAAIIIAGFVAPFLFPAYSFQFAMLWLMIVFALTWDILGGQMGYNSLGNIFFFGLGMYVCAVTQVGLYYDVAEYTAHFGAVKVDFTAEHRRSTPLEGAPNARSTTSFARPGHALMSALGQRLGRDWGCMSGI